jgi:ubiquitin carboxyl-terminal hydrolase 10
MCSVNAVLQLLVHSPPFWNLFRLLGDLKEQRGTGPETDGGATPLVDATVRFVEEFVFKEKELPATQQPPQLAAGGKLKEDEEAEKDDDSADPFEPTFLYHAMKENGQLKDFFAGTSVCHVARCCC